VTHGDAFESRKYRPLGTIRAYDPNHQLRWIKGDGPFLWDETGRRYLDCVSGYSANILGHCHPRIVDALTDQARCLAFATGGESVLRDELERSLSRLLSIPHPGRMEKVWLSTTGARAIEVAWRIAFASRPGKLVTFDLGYHGRSIGTSYMSDTDRVECLGVSTIRIPIPFPRTADGKSLEGACDESLDVARRLFETSGSEISALLMEPAIGSRGYFFATDSYFQRLVALARASGCLIIADEVQMGLGRLGSMVASQSQGWEADLLVLGKALGGGMLPISAVIGPDTLMDRLPPGMESETFAGMPLACRVALEILQVLNESSIIQTSVQLHERLRIRLRNSLPSDVVEGHGSATVVDVRKGMVSGDRDTDMARGANLAQRITQLLRDRGILVHLTGPNRDRIALIPPLLVPAEWMERLGEHVERAWHESLTSTLGDSPKKCCLENPNRVSTTFSFGCSVFPFESRGSFGL
jgi:4-aminobutyrate aminotransferase-like enzyme